MQFKTVLVSAFVGIAAAQDVSGLIGQLPACSLSCLTQGAASAGCAATDYSCQCNHADQIQTNATSCLAAACSATDIGTVQTISSKICAAVNGNSTSTNGTSSSNSTATSGSGSSSTASSTGSSSSSTSSSTAGSSAGNRLAALGWIGIAGIAGLMVM